MSWLLERLIGEDIELVASLAPSLAPVTMDPGQFEQVLFNLAVNARDAMPDGGKLTIETANIELDTDYAATHPGASVGWNVVVAVSDTGIGMSQDVQERIFEPFFTTKELGKGTGLGLATVYGIVKQSGGSIGVYSEPGGGATFKIYFPRAEAPVDTAPAAPVADLTRGTETVLLVEDAEPVRASVRRMLERCGYVVLEAESGAAALELARAHGRPIHLLLTDVVLTDMKGTEVAIQLAHVRPELRVLYMSGYTDDAIVRNGVLQAGIAFLQKPFTLSALARKIRSVLDAPPSARSP